MASVPPNTKDLIDAANRLSTQMAQRYMNVVRLAKLPVRGNGQSNRRGGGDDDDGNDELLDTLANEAAVNTLSMDVEVTSLKTTAEELLSLTRRLKEMWLFGQLDLLGDGHGAEGASEVEDAGSVAQMLATMLHKAEEQQGPNSETTA